MWYKLKIFVKWSGQAGQTLYLKVKQFFISISPVQMLLLSVISRNGWLLTILISITNISATIRSENESSTIKLETNLYKGDYLDLRIIGGFYNCRSTVNTITTLWGVVGFCNRNSPKMEGKKFITIKTPINQQIRIITNNGESISWYVYLKYLYIIFYYIKSSY